MNVVFYLCDVKKNDGVVVQPVRMPACHAGGRGFESRPFRKKHLRSYASVFCFIANQVFRYKFAYFVIDNNNGKHCSVHTLSGIGYHFGCM